MADPRGWLVGREPRPPAELSHRLEVISSPGESISETLGTAAGRHLEEALARPGRNRDGALHLLTADAMMTYACEATADEESMEDSLACLLARLQLDRDRCHTRTGP